MQAVLNASPCSISWYRSPELLFGARSYTDAVDNWAAGCIFAELMLRLPYMAGETDFGQLEVIFRALGTPTEDEWPVRGFVHLCQLQLRLGIRFRTDRA